MDTTIYRTDISASIGRDLYTELQGALIHIFSFVDDTRVGVINVRWVNHVTTGH